ncbi:glycine dehydrogenase [Aureococcus anophagefferens]|nr:glycine dehydrogenase [Aureococcus anophagefferens]
MSQMVSGGPTAYLQQMKDGFKYEPCKVIAEIGCNHMGSFETAKELMLLAKATGAGYAKFQKRCPRELLTKEQYDAPHPVPHNAYGQTYGAHREFLEFSKEQHEQLHAYGKEIGIEWATSIEDVVAFFEATGQAKRLVVYNCTSGYPVPFPSVCMLELVRLYERYGDRVKELAFSGHHLGIAIDVAAYTLGAKWIERHFTKDRTWLCTWKGTDHAASLEAGGFGKLVRDLEATHQALTLKASEILPIEDEQRDKPPTHRNSTRAPAWTAGTGELGPARVHRIVITGGPCAGKTTAMSKLSLRLTNMGFDVFVVPELATLTITGGASPGSYDVAQHVGWETAILREQMHLEDCFEEIAAKVSLPLGRHAVLLCDRGTMDVLAYVGKDAFDEVCEENGWTVPQLRDQRYEAVVHLVTAAVGAEAFYTLENNKARSESRDEAVALDGKLSRAWAKPHWWIVEAPSGLPADCEHAEWRLEHIFLKTSDGTESRITRKSQPGLTTYHHRVRGERVNGEHSVAERTLSLREFKALLKNADPERSSIKKTRKAFIWQNEYYLLDTFHSPPAAAGTTTLFVEKPVAETRSSFPPFLELKSDVTTTEWFSSRRDRQRTMAMAGTRAPTAAHDEGLTPLAGGAARGRKRSRGAAVGFLEAIAACSSLHHLFIETMSLTGARRLGLLRGVLNRQRAAFSTAPAGGDRPVATVVPLSTHEVKTLDPLDTFEQRHMGPSEADQTEMLATLGFASLDELVSSTVPANIRLTEPLEPGQDKGDSTLELGSHQSEAMAETEALALLETMAKKNKVLKSMMGLGYHETHTPLVILRNMLENPGWYTAYTPYQAEISQGRLEMLLNYQTLVTELTGMEMASVALDEATARRGHVHRYGVPMGFGGPHAAYMATSEKYARRMPGRIIGETVEANERKGRALRMAMQTREQHIRRDKATAPAFDTIVVSGVDAAGVAKKAEAAGFNLRVLGPAEIGVSFGETVTRDDLATLLGDVFGCRTVGDLDDLAVVDRSGERGSILPHAVFNSHRSESQMLRYLLCANQIFNPTSISRVHPAPVDQTAGYAEMIDSLNADLCKITGFDAVSVQPNSGASGEYAGLLAIRAYQASQGQGHRDVCLIPVSAHGTNPASAVMAGLRVVTVKSDAAGNVDLEDFNAKAEKHKDNLSAIMITHRRRRAALIPITGESAGKDSAVAAAPYGSALILPISWMYIKMLGAAGLTRASAIAILNANYMAKRLEESYDVLFRVLFRGANGQCAHEFIIDLRSFKKCGVVEEDVAKRLQDYGFHSPTMSWPVPGTLMIEPTESEDKEELDRFCDALIAIRGEIAAVADGAP